MTIQYCDSNFPITCLSKSILGFLPSVVVVLLGQWSLRDLTFETQNLQLPITTPVHSMKMLFILSLMALPLANLILYLVSEVDNKELLPILVYSLAISNWLVSLGILRKEYKRLGYTSTYTRMFWFIAMMADLILSFILPIENKNKINQFGIISFISTTILVQLNIYGYLNRKDSPKAMIIDELRNEFDKLREARAKNGNFFKASYINSLQKPDTGNEVSPGVIMEKFLRINTKKLTSNEVPLKIDSGLGSLDSYKKSFGDEIEQIGIPRMEEALRHGKQTPVYVILYIFNRKLMTTRRSYAEFLQIYTSTRDSYPDEVIQNFPLKNSKNADQTRIQLEKFLNYLCEKKLLTAQLYEFLRPEDEVPYFGSFTGRISRKTSYTPPDLRKSVGTPGSFALKSESEERKSNVSRSSRKTLSFGQPFGMNEASSFFKDFNPPNQDPKQTDLNSQLINNYNRFSMGNIDDKVYKVNILSAEIKEDDIYYHITVSCAGIARTVVKTYEDFEELHEAMENFAELSEVEMQELPDKGNAGFMVSRADPKLVDYRKFALKNYLQYIMFNSTLRYCPAVRNFLEINYSAINPNF